MPDQPAEKIAEILAAHNGGHICTGGAQMPPYADDIWAAHVAEVLVAELGLTAETAFRYTHNASGRSTIIESTSADVRIARKIAGDTHTLTEVSRYVTDWQAQ